MLMCAALEASYGGEDAYFASDVGGGALGVADGVGGWADSEVNPAGAAPLGSSPPVPFAMSLYQSPPESFRTDVRSAKNDRGMPVGASCLTAGEQLVVSNNLAGLGLKS